MLRTPMFGARPARFDPRAVLIGFVLLAAGTVTGFTVAGSATRTLSLIHI